MMRRDILKSLISEIKDCSVLLKEHEVRFWYEKLHNMSTKETLTLHDLKKIEGWFGSMGSINDLYVSHLNGHKIEEQDEHKVNQKLSTILDRIYIKNQSLIKEHN